MQVEFNFEDDLPVIYVVNPNTDEFMKYIRREMIFKNGYFYVVITDDEVCDANSKKAKDLGCLNSDQLEELYQAEILRIERENKLKRIIK